MKAQRTEREDISIAVCWSLGVMECRSDELRVFTFKAGRLTSAYILNLLIFRFPLRSLRLSG